MAGQRGEPSPLRGCHQHPWGQGAKAELRGGTGDVGLDPAPSSALPCSRTQALVLRPHGPAAVACQGSWVPLSQGEGSVCVQGPQQEELGPSWLL